MSSEVQSWRLSVLCPANIHSNSVFHIHRERRSLSKAGAVNFMYHLWNYRRGHVLCSILLQKQVRPFFSQVLKGYFSEEALCLSLSSQALLQAEASCTNGSIKHLQMT